MELDVSLTYYDKILIAIGASLGGGVLVGVVTSYPLLLGVFAGSLVATVCIYDAVFRNPPRPAVSSRTIVAAVVWHVFLGVLLAAVL